MQRHSTQNKVCSALTTYFRTRGQSLMIFQMARMIENRFRGSSPSCWKCRREEGGRVRPSAEGIHVLGNLDRTSSCRLHSVKCHFSSFYHLLQTRCFYLLVSLFSDHPPVRRNGRQDIRRCLATGVCTNANKTCVLPPHCRPSEKPLQVFENGAIVVVSMLV